MSSGLVWLGSLEDNESKVYALQIAMLPYIDGNGLLKVDIKRTMFKMSAFLFQMELQKREKVADAHFEVPENL